MDINSAFPSKYLRAADVTAAEAKKDSNGNRRKVVAVIDSVRIEDVGQDREEHKPVMFFRGGSKGLVLNKTNGNALAEMFGSETDTWVGIAVQLYTESVQFAGRSVRGIRIKVPEQGAQQQQEPLLPQTSADPVAVAPPPAQSLQFDRPANQIPDEEVPF